MSGRTLTSVRDEAGLLAQRRSSLLRDRGLLAGMELYAQVLLGLPLYLYEGVGTPGYLSLLLLLPFLLLLLLAAGALARRGAGQGGALSLAGRRAGRLLAFLLFLSALLDAALAFFGLCAMTNAVMTDLSPHAGPLAVLTFAALSLARPGRTPCRSLPGCCGGSSAACWRSARRRPRLTAGCPTFSRCWGEARRPSCMARCG